MNQHSCGSNTCVFGPPRGMGTNGPCTCLGEGVRITNLERAAVAQKIAELRMELVESNAALNRMMRDRDEYYDKYHDRREAFDELLGKIRAKLIEWQSKRLQPWVDSADIIKDLCELVGEKPIEHDPDREGVYNRGAGTCQSGMDGECNWDSCPQLRDGEPAKSGRHCPLWKDPEDC